MPSCPAGGLNEAQTYQYDGFNRLFSGLVADEPIRCGGQPGVSGYTGSLPSPTMETPRTTDWFTASNRMNGTAASGWVYDPMGNVKTVGGMTRNFNYEAENILKMLWRRERDSNPR